MKLMTWKPASSGALILILFVAAASAQAQQTEPTTPWSIEAAVGWDNGISGNINSSGIGTLNNQAVVIKANSYEDVYGTGLHLRFGGAYFLNEDTEITGVFTFQSLDADQVVPMGDIGVSNLYGEYSDYQTFGLDVGLRRYLRLTDAIHGYGEGTLGLGFVDKVDVRLVAPSISLTRDANDFYDQTTAFAVGFNLGVMFKTAPRVGVFAQLGFRWMSGMAEVDDLQGTGLDDINNKSSRWTMPFVGGVRYRF
jgi:hypothetical protein